MKRSIFIIISSVLVVILIAIWLYVLFYSTPPENNEDTYGELNLTGSEAEQQPNTNIIIDPAEETAVDVTGTEKLRQLTTRPTIGHQEISAKNKLFYIEAGTGHIYSIDLVSGEEKRVSGTTLSTSQTGAITPDGQFAMIQSGSGSNSKTTLGKISNGTSTTLQGVVSPDDNIIDFVATEDNTFLYAKQTNSSVLINQYNPQNNTKQTLFTVPFREMSIDWGKTVNSVHYVYPKANSKLEGFVYKVKGSQAERVGISGYGLSASGNDEYVIYSEQNPQEYTSSLFNVRNNTSRPLVKTVIPDKCTAVRKTTDIIICAQTNTSYKYDLPDSWYQGRTIYTDNLWAVDTQENSATFLVNTKDSSGRELDIINLSTNLSDTKIYFTNKNDRTLWSFDWSSDNRLGL